MTQVDIAFRMLGCEVQYERSGVRLEWCDLGEVFEDSSNSEEVVRTVVEVSHCLSALKAGLDLRRCLDSDEGVR